MWFFKKKEVVRPYVLEFVNKDTFVITENYLWIVKSKCENTTLGPALFDLIDHIKIGSIIINISKWPSGRGYSLKFRDDLAGISYPEIDVSDILEVIYDLLKGHVLKSIDNFITDYKSLNLKEDEPYDTYENVMNYIFNHGL